MDTIEEMPREALALVSELAADIRRRVTKIDELNEALKAEQTALIELETRRLPDAMSDLGFTTVRMEDGSVIDVGPEYHCGIPKAKKAEALEWLRDHNYGDLIKTTVWAEFGRGEDESAATLLKELKLQFPDRVLGLDEGVHASTLKALVKEQHESGDPLPEDLFGVFIINRATIKTPKLNTKSRK